MATTHQNETAAAQPELAVVEKAQPASQRQFEFISFSNISKLVFGGDRKTEIEDQVDAPCSCMWPKTFPLHHHHLRVVLHGVGHAISEFKCTKQLVTAIFNAVQAHSHAFNVANILHGDISAGNIILTDEGRGLLIDWELAKNADGGSRRFDRMGTWQFISADLLRHPDKMRTFTDELESLLHVLGWMTLRYLPADDSYRPLDRRMDLSKFNKCYPADFNCGRWRRTGKCSALHGKSYPSEKFQPRNPTPLSDLATELSGPFQSLYAARPPTAEDRMKILNIPRDLLDDSLLIIHATVMSYDEDVACLQSSDWFIDEIQKALDENVWPTDDAAGTNLHKIEN